MEDVYLLLKLDGQWGELVQNFCWFWRNCQHVLAHCYQGTNSTNMLKAGNRNCWTIVLTCEQLCRKTMRDVAHGREAAYFTGTDAERVVIMRLTFFLHWSVFFGRVS